MPFQQSREPAVIDSQMKKHQKEKQSASVAVKHTASELVIHGRQEKNRKSNGNMRSFHKAAFLISVWFL